MIVLVSLAEAFFFLCVEALVAGRLHAQVSTPTTHHASHKVCPRNQATTTGVHASIYSVPQKNTFPFVYTCLRGLSMCTPQSGHKPGSASCTKGQCRHAVTALAETVLQHTLSQKKMNVLHMSEWRLVGMAVALLLGCLFLAVALFVRYAIFLRCYLHPRLCPCTRHASLHVQLAPVPGTP